MHKNSSSTLFLISLLAGIFFVFPLLSQSYFGLHENTKSETRCCISLQQKKSSKRNIEIEFPRLKSDEFSKQVLTKKVENLSFFLTSDRLRFFFSYLLEYPIQTENYSAISDLKLLTKIRMLC